MFDNIQKIYKTFSSIDLSKDEKYGYERVIYLALYTSLFENIKTLNLAVSRPLYATILLWILEPIHKKLLEQFQDSNDVIVAEIENEHRELLAKFNVYNITHVATDLNQKEILSKKYIYQLRLHNIHIRFIKEISEVITRVANVVSIAHINPFQFAALIWFIESTFGDLLDMTVSDISKQNSKVQDLENYNNKLVAEYVDNNNIIYECLEEDTYLHDLATKIGEHYNIRKRVDRSFTTNNTWRRYEMIYHKKVNLLNWVLPNNPILVAIYQEIRWTCYSIGLVLLDYNDCMSQLNLLDPDDKVANLPALLPEKCDIDIGLLKNGVLFRLHNISFKFNDCLLFNADDLIIPSMKWITVKGASGAGKTTLCGLLLKILYIESGVIFLNKYEKYDYNSIRQYISYVKPSLDLFDKSIEFNVKFGVKDKNSELVNNLIMYYMTLFRLDKYVDNLDTNINNLSTGEKQRIKIIRCILQDRPIWFLDEITSNIDKECEKIVLSVLHQIQIRKKKSVFHITHSVTSKNACDFVLSIKNCMLALS